MTDQLATPAPEVEKKIPTAEEIEIEKLKRYIATLEGNIGASLPIFREALGAEKCGEFPIAGLAAILVKQRNDGKIECARLREDRRGLAERIQQLRGIIEKSENLKELERLRIEVSSLHRQCDGWKKYQEEVEAEVKEAKLEVVRARNRAAALESTAAQMQLCRDRAQTHVATAIRALTEERAARAAAESSAEVKGKALSILEAWHGAVTAIHQKGHPAAVEGCKLCTLIGTPKAGAEAVKP